jgi:hypothetical protein
MNRRKVFYCLNMIMKEESYHKGGAPYSHARLGSFHYLHPLSFVPFPVFAPNSELPTPNFFIDKLAGYVLEVLIDLILDKLHS